MKHSSIPAVLIAVAVVVGLAAALVPAAQSQVASNYQPIGVAASGNSSTVWFHQPSTGRVLACQSAAGAGTAISGIECVATKLP